MPSGRRSCSGLARRAGAEPLVAGRSTPLRSARSSPFDFAALDGPRMGRAADSAERCSSAQMAWVYLIDAGLAPVGLAIAFATVESPVGVVLALPLIGLLAVFSRERRVRIDSELELRDAYRGTVFLLGDVVEADDDYTGAHSRDVVDLSLVGRGRARPGRARAPRHRVRGAPPRRRQGADPERDHQQARQAHARGARRSSRRTRSRASGCSTASAACSARSAGSSARATSAGTGRGYPDGLAGEEIPLVARIVCCCDAFNAMTTDRSYRKALPVADALAEIERCSRQQFDPQVVEALLTVQTRTSVAAA